MALGRPPKFNFLAEDTISKDNEPFIYRVTINNRGMLFFPKDAVELYELGGQFLKLFGDIESKALGWTVIKGKTDLETLDGCRKMKLTKAGGVVLSVQKLLRVLKIPEDVSFKRLEVKKYQGSYMEDDIFYVELTKEFQTIDPIKKEGVVGQDEEVEPEILEEVLLDNQTND